MALIIDTVIKQVAEFIPKNGRCGKRQKLKERAN